MDPRLQLLFRFALALIPLPILWFAAIEPYQTLRSLSPVEAVLLKADEKIFCARTGSRGGVGSCWVGARVGVSYEYQGTRFRPFAELQIDSEIGMTDTDVKREVAALQPLVGNAITVWVDARNPREAYVHRRMRSTRAWAWIAVAILFWTWIFSFRQLFVADPVEPGSGEIVRTIGDTFSRDRR